MKTNVSHIFHCPLHGPEINVLCFRAFSEENLELWRKYEVSYRELEFRNDEKEKLLNDLRLFATSGVPA